MFWKKLTRDQEVEKRLQSVLSVLFSETEIVFTELELVQITNDLRRNLALELNKRKLDCISRSVEQKQKADEIESAINFIE